MTFAHSVRTSARMKLYALLAALALAMACATPPDLDHRPTAAEVQPAPFHSQHGIYFKVVDDGTTPLHQMFDRMPVEAPDGVTRAVERWRVDDDQPEVTGIYLTAPSREALARTAATLQMPADHELAYGRIDGDRWRTYLVFAATELDASAIARADVTRDANSELPTVVLELTPTGAQRFADLTARIAGHRLAVLVDGSVVSAPVVRSAITGGRAEITLGAASSDAQARALADQLSAPH